MSRRIHAALLVAALRGAAAPNAGAEPYSSEIAAGPESGAGRLIWAAASGEGATLMTVDARTGAPQVLGVPQLDRFTGTLELGRDRAGEPMAVYSGCRGNECATYRYDFATARERRLHVPRGPRGCKTTAMSVDRGVLYLAYDGRRCRSGIYAARPRSMRRVIAAKRILDVDVTGRRIVFSQTVGSAGSRLVLADLQRTGRTSVVATNDNPDADVSGFLNPTIDEGRLTYGSLSSDGQGDYGAIVQRRPRVLEDCSRLARLRFGGSDGPLPDFAARVVPAPLGDQLYLLAADPTTQARSLHRVAAPEWETC